MILPLSKCIANPRERIRTTIRNTATVDTEPEHEGKRFWWSIRVLATHAGLVAIGIGEFVAHLRSDSRHDTQTLMLQVEMGPLGEIRATITDEVVKRREVGLRDATPELDNEPTRTGLDHVAKVSEVPLP